MGDAGGRKAQPVACVCVRVATHPFPFPLASVVFRVAEIEAMASFYERVLGLEPIDQVDRGLADGPSENASDGTNDSPRPGKKRSMSLMAADEGFGVHLDEHPEATARPRPSIGLYHVAYRLPDRASLAGILLHLKAEEVQIDGAADHGVSEALYLSDPEGNGIELYRDRPQEAWPTQGDQVAMVTEPLDVQDLLAQAEGPAPPPEATVIGHIHLHVPALGPAERFFAEGLGLQVRQRTLPGALFLADGDYHHHVGINTWAGSSRAGPEAIGLDSYEWTGAPHTALEVFEKLGATVEAGEHEARVEDPAGTWLRMTGLV